MKRDDVLFWIFVTSCVILGLFLLVTRGFLEYAHASGADCGLISDNDARRQCYAIRDRKPADCNLIQDNDQRRLCRAQSGDR